MSGRDSFDPLLVHPGEEAAPAVVPTLWVGELLALAGSTGLPLVSHPGQATPRAVPARSLVALDGRHVGRAVALMFDGGDLARPVIVGLVQGQDAWPAPRPPGQVELESDGERLVVSARRQLVLRCGEARITLSEDGLVEIRGEEIVTQAVGRNRMRGGSIELN
jgi:hypothetical protein